MTVETTMNGLRPSLRTWQLSRYTRTSDWSMPTAGERLRFNSFCLFRAERLLTRDGTPVTIGGRAFDLLLALIDRAGEVVSARELHTLVWPDVLVEEANLRVCVAALRKALGEQSGGPRYVVNVAGRGYTFVAPVHRTVPDDGPLGDAPGLPSGPAPCWRPPHLLVSHDETVDILSRLLASGSFVRLLNDGSVTAPEVSHTLLAILHGACGLDAACFVCRRPPTDLADHCATASASPVDLAGELDVESRLHAFLAGTQLLIVLGRYRLKTTTDSALFTKLFRAPSLHFLITNREARSAQLENSAFVAPFEAGGAAAAPMIDALHQIGVNARPYHRWHAEDGIANGNETRRIEDLQKENERLRKVISDLTLEKLILKEASLGNF